MIARMRHNLAYVRTTRTGRIILAVYWVWLVAASTGVFGLLYAPDLTRRDAIL